MKWDPLVHRTLKVLTKQFGVRRGDTLLAAVSGGADSICLLHLLHTLTAHLKIRLECVHVHHGIRGGAADHDADFVRAFCEERGIPFLLKRVDAPAYRDAHPHVSLEEAARILRYRALSEAGASPGFFICTAHNADDNAETVLLNLFRGGGIRAMAGMPVLRDNILRPLLSVSRAEIEAYNQKQGLSFTVDETNADTAFARNAIRHELLPCAKEKVNAGAAVHLSENAEEFRSLVHWLDVQAAEGLARCGRDDGMLSVRALRREDPFLQGEILRLFLGETQSGEKEVTRRHIRDVLALVHSSNGNARLPLPGGRTLVREHDHLRLCR